MVFYYTSMNIKMLRHILLDYEDVREMSPYEYMKIYLENCPENTNEIKLSWISNTFLGIEKHLKFLKEIVSNMSEDMTEEDLYYGIIVLHAIIFHLQPKEMDPLYKSLFNISKPLLDSFTKFLSNNEVLTYVSQVARTMYDTEFVTKKIIGPLFVWQPYISEMSHNYAEFVKKTESKKVKPPTVPVQPTVLCRKNKESPLQSTPMMPGTPPNSLYNKTPMRKPLTRSAIDKRLRAMHEKNKQKANSLLDDINNKDYHFAQTKKSERYYKKISDIKEETENDNVRTLPIRPKKILVKTKLPPIKETTATLKRLNKRIKEAEEEEMEYLHNLLDLKDPLKIEKLEEHDRQEKEKERMLEIEKKHVLGQLSYEEAVIAKKNVYEQKKKKYEEFLKEKECWAKEIENWKKAKIMETKKHFENLSMCELNIADAKMAILNKKKELASKLKKETQMIIAEAVKRKQEELEERIQMIKEIKILAMIAKKARVPKIIDLTETSGLGLLSEMSIAELKERLSAMKIGIKEELERKKALVREQNATAKQELEEVKSSIKTYFSEKAPRKRLTAPKNIELDVPQSKEICDLKKKLEQKRRLRVMLTHERN